MKRRSGYNWDKKSKDYPYLKSSDSQIVPYKAIRDLVEHGFVNSVLDVGCFTGAMAELLQELPIRYLGFDCSTLAIESARKRVDLDFKGGEIDTFECGQFDLLYFGGMFIYTRYDDTEVLRYLDMCRPKYILCTDVIRKGWEKAYPNLKKHEVVLSLQYEIMGRNSKRFMYLFKINGKETI